jgi:hypothetical protein
MPRGATATILFTDLAGSTDLLARLGEAGFDELRRSAARGCPMSAGCCVFREHFPKSAVAFGGRGLPKL